MKIIKTVLIMCICILAFPITAMAAEETYSSGHFYYHSHEGYVSICGYLGNESNVTIPDTMSGRPVSEIEDYAFDNCNSVKTITIPATVTMIGEQAFIGAPSLEKIISQTEGVNIIAKENVEIKTSQADDKTDKEESTGSKGSEELGNSGNSGNSTDKKEAENQQENTETVIGNGGYEEPQDAKEIEKSDAVVTVDENKHLITIDKNGNYVILDDIEEYTMSEEVDGSIVIKNSKGEKVTTDENGNVGIPGKTALNQKDKTETNEKTNLSSVIYIVVIVVAVLIASIGIAYYCRKHKK